MDDTRNAAGDATIRFTDPSVNYYVIEYYVNTTCGEPHSKPLPREPVGQGFRVRSR